MRRYYSTLEYHLYNERRRLRQERRSYKQRKAIRRKRKGGRANPVRAFSGFVAAAPERFSLIDNYDASIDFLYKVDANAWHDRHLFVDLSPILSIAPCAIMALMAILERAQAKNGARNVRGNAPKDPYCKRVFLNSGFYRIVNSSYKHQDDDAILSVRSSDSVISEDAGAVVAFVRDKLKIGRGNLTRAVYTTIMETMNNVREHAYSEISYNKWWLMALYSEEEAMVRFALLDNGRGIPSTIRRKLPDLFTGSDSNLIRSTMLGENRTETRLAYRGNGLPRIKMLADNRSIRNLYVISKNGFYLVDKDMARDTAVYFRGTLISWDFCKES